MRLVVTLNDIARKCGLDGAGIAPAFPVPVYRPKLEQLVTRVPPDLAYLQRRLHERLNPGALLKGVKSVIVVFISYASTLPGVEALPKGHGFISRFAWSKDYHEVVGQKVRKFADSLEKKLGVKTRWYVDTGPILEKAYAVAAGLGFQGRNTLFIHPEYGSFVFLGSVLTDLEPEGTVSQKAEDGCGTCDACVRACPTGALQEPYVLDVSRCLAYKLVSKHVPMEECVKLNLAGNLFACDLCQDVCPWNKNAVCPNRPEFAPLPGTYMPRLADILDMDDLSFSSVFGDTPVRKRTLPLLKATARVLMQRTTRLRHR